MQFDDFKLDEKYDEYEAMTELRRDSEFQMKEAIRLKKDELKSYNKLFRLYGAESPLLQGKNLSREFEDSKSSIPTVNKVLETKHNIGVENQILNFFIFIASVFLLFQFSIIAIIKLDVEFPSLEFINYHIFFHYAYLVVLVLGKTLTYVFMMFFFARVYIGLKVFTRSVNTGILLKLINLQFIGFFSSSSIVTIGIIGLDLLFKITLTQLDIVDESIKDYHYNDILRYFKLITGYLDILFYGTMIIGGLLTITRMIIKMFVSNNSIKLDEEKT